MISFFDKNGEHIILPLEDFTKYVEKYKNLQKFSSELNISKSTARELLNNYNTIYQNKQYNISQYSTWTPEEDLQLKKEYEEKLSIDEISKIHKRTRGAIRSRLLHKNFFSLENTSVNNSILEVQEQANKISINSSISNIPLIDDVYDVDVIVNGLGKDFFNKYYSNIKIDSLNLSYRLYNRLKLNDIDNLAKFMITPISKLKKIRSLGKASLNEAILFKENFLSKIKMGKIEQTAFNKKNINVEDLYNYLPIDSLLISDELKSFCYDNHIDNFFYLLKLESINNISLNEELNIIKDYYISLKTSSFINKYVSILKIKNYSLDKINFSHLFDNIKEEDYEKYFDFGIKVGEFFCEFLDKYTTKRTADIVKLRMNMLNNENNTLEHIGNQFGISRERVRQIVCKVERKFKHPIYKKRYLNPIISLINSIDEKEILNYYIYGILSLYHKRFLKFILDTIDMEYSNNIFKKIDELIYLLHKETYPNINSKTNKPLEIISLITFPRNTCDYKDRFNNLKTERIVNMSGNFGILYIEKFNNNFQYESILEKQILEILAKNPEVIDIKVQSLEINYTFNGKDYKYYPDFQILLKDGRMAIIEVKPLYNMGDVLVKKKYKVLKMFCEKYGIGYLMVDNQLNNYEQIKKYAIDEKLKRDFYTFLNIKKNLNYKDFIIFKKKYKIKTIDLINIVINDDNIKFSTSPFYISYNK